MPFDIDMSNNVSSIRERPAPMTASSITRDQWQHFLDTYRPVEDDLIRKAMQTDFTSQGDEAGAIAGRSVASAAGAAERNIRRSGATLTAEERAAVGRRQDLTSTKTVARAENTTRRVLSDTRTNLLSSIVGIGRGVANTASAGKQSVAEMAAAREGTHISQKARTESGNLSAAASAAALLIAFV